LDHLKKSKKPQERIKLQKFSLELENTTTNVNYLITKIWAMQKHIVYIDTAFVRFDFPKMFIDQ